MKFKYKDKLQIVKSNIEYLLYVEENNLQEQNFATPISGKLIKIEKKEESTDDDGNSSDSSLNDVEMEKKKRTVEYYHL